ncbi:iron chelate uptake ABC transporter family permease subunit, partial [Pseudomonas aeruginosa]|uniref:iron chelate uptake ABC transporter family permease subunit n=1 Tax=Pseudomonas aeruginosa TaxID=287 RepID=UPI001E2FD308
MTVNDRVATERQHVLAFVLAGGVLLLMAVVVALSFGRDAHGWTWASGALLEDLMPWRWPRIMAALFAGVMLAVAGCIIQRLTGNPMASPEVLGISSGAAFGVVVMLFLVPGNAFGWLLPAGSPGGVSFTHLTLPKIYSVQVSVGAKSTTKTTGHRDRGAEPSYIPRHSAERKARPRLGRTVTTTRG